MDKMTIQHKMRGLGIKLIGSDQIGETLRVTIASKDVNRVNTAVSLLCESADVTAFERDSVYADRFNIVIA